MGSTSRMRTAMLAVVAMSVAGAMAVLACGPAAVPAVPAGSGATASESLSVPATEAPFVLPQSGDGGRDGGEGTPTETPTDEPTETLTPTATRYVPPTADRSLCSDSYDLRTGAVIGTRCPPDGHALLSYDLRAYYNVAMIKNDAKGLSGDSLEFPDVYVYIKVKSGYMDGVVRFLQDEGAVVMHSGLGAGGVAGNVYAYLSVGLLPALMDVEGVGYTYEDTSSHPGPEGFTSLAHHIVDDELWLRYKSVADANMWRERRSEASLQYPSVRILITAWAASDVDPIVEFLKANGGQKIVFTKVDDGSSLYGSGTVEADVSLGLLGDISKTQGVRKVVEVKVTSKVSGSSAGSAGGISGRQVPSTTPTPVPVAVSLQADQWHRAGFTGAGVEVAVIDGGFAGFRARVLPFLSQPVPFLCYRGPYLAPAEGVLHLDGTEQDLDGDRTSGFSVCEFGSDHGTAVTESLVEVAPDVVLYVSNPTTPGSSVPLNREHTVNWLTAGVGDNVIGVLPYSINGNDRFNVQIINRSGSGRWDGPGDGTSPFFAAGGRSVLSLSDGVVADGVLWVNSAGNRGDKTWFSYDPDFETSSMASRRRLLDLDGSGTICNSFEVLAGRNYSAQLRWWDDWPGAVIDLDLLFYPVSGVVSGALSETDGVMGGRDPQSGADGSDDDGEYHYPREYLHFRAGTVAAGTVAAGTVAAGDYCLAVELKSGVRPEWVQLQMWHVPDSVFLRFSTDAGSLNNAADSINDGLLSVGFTDAGGMTVDPVSARGPAPWERNRLALDLVSDGSHPSLAGVRGSSAAAPRVAGLAALVIQALGDRPLFDTPAEVAWYMKNSGSTRRDCVHDWGCGFAVLPPLDPPTSLSLESVPNACPVLSNRGYRRANNVRLVYVPPTNANPDVHLAYAVDLKKVGDPDTDASDLRLSSGGSSALLPGGETYVARAYTCLPGVSGEPVCGPASTPSNELTVSRQVCQPVVVDAHTGDGILTLWWNHQLDATSYEVSRLDDDGDPVEGGGVTTGSNHLVFRGLAAGEDYRFRVRAVGPSGTSDWSRVAGDSPRNVSPVPQPLSPIGALMEETNADWPRVYDAAFGWLYGGGSASYELRVREVGSTTWSTLSSDLGDGGDGPHVVFYTEPRLRGGGLRRVRAGLTGLVPGTDYEFQVRGVNGAQVSPWTDVLAFRTLGHRPSMGGDRPPMPAGLRVASNASVPFPRVVLGWDASAAGYLREIRVMGGGIDTWRRLPHQPAGWSSEYSVQYPTDDQAFITNLTPGTEYRFAVRAARERNSQEMLDHSPWSRPVTVTTAGVRPSNAPGEATAPALKAPPEDLMAEVDRDNGEPVVDGGDEPELR